MPISSNADVLAYIRAEMGDATSTSYEVSDSMIDYLYDNKASSDVDKTIAYALRLKCTELSNKVAQTNTETGQTVQRQQEREAICMKAKEWAEAQGLDVGSGKVSVRFGIVERDTSNE